MKFMRFLITGVFALSLFCQTAAAGERLKMSTTTSTQDSGLLKVLLPPFEKKHNVKVDVIAVGTGQALKLGEAGDVDVVFVHARKPEDRFVADGFGVNRRDVMYNDFVIIGPKGDPAGIAMAKSAAEALKLIAANGAIFISRGDKSGTHIKEKELWQSAGIEPKGNWYVAWPTAAPTTPSRVKRAISSSSSRERKGSSIPTASSPSIRRSIRT